MSRYSSYHGNVTRYITRVTLVDGGNLTDEDMSHVSELPLLRYLEIQYCDEIGDEGLQHLSKLSRLKTLKLVQVVSLSLSLSRVMSRVVAPYNM